MNFYFRSALESDFPFLLSLRQKTMDVHIRNAKLTSSEESHWQRIYYRFDCAKIIVVDKTDIGLLKVVREERVWDLVQIQLLPAFQGKGIGGAIISALMAEAFAKDAEIKLSVFKSNPVKRLYESLGFISYAETETTFEMQVCVRAE